MSAVGQPGARLRGGASPRELQIIALRERGMSARRIAVELGIELSTAEALVKRLTPDTRTEPAAQAARLGSEALLAAIRRHHPERCVMGAPPSS